jgi:DNA-binding CsgD family transcriptional regulator
MDTKDILNKEFFAQDFSGRQPYAKMLNRYKEIACNYARMENAIAVLSDLRTNESYIYYGGFLQMLGFDENVKDSKVASIWEEEIFKIIHPDDLTEKHLQELCFYHFVKQRPQKERTNYYLMSKLRMKNKTDSYVSVLHRIFYVSIPTNDTLWLALCLYSPLVFDIPAKCIIINSIDGHITDLEEHNNEKILSVREKQVLKLINKGLMSKEIAGILSISIYTVNRHRQDILGKLQVKNSIEACRIAKNLKLI